MKKNLILAMGLLGAASVFAGRGNVVVSFSTPGPDKYADGSVVLDGECYALVATPAGETFSGIQADGTAAGNSKVVLTVPVAKDGKCPRIVFEVTEEYLTNNKLTGEGITWGVYLLDTRRFATDADGVVQKDASGKPIVASVGGSAVNGYGEVAQGTGSIVTGTSDSAAKSAIASLAPEAAKNLKIRDIKFVGDNVYLYVSGSLSCLRYELQSGTDPSKLTPVTGVGEKYGTDEEDMILVTPKQEGGAFFKVNRK